MPDTGKIRGKKLRVGNTEDSGTTYDYVAHSDSFTFTSSFGVDTVTDNDSAANFADKLPNDTEWSLSGEMYLLFDTETDKDQAMDIAQYHLDQTKVGVKFTTVTSGNKEYNGNGYYNQFTVTGSTSDYIKASFEFTGTGAYTIDTIA